MMNASIERSIHSKWTEVRNPREKCSAVSAAANSLTPKREMRTEETSMLILESQDFVSNSVALTKHILVPKTPYLSDHTKGYHQCLNTSVKWALREREREYQNRAL